MRKKVLVKFLLLSILINLLGAGFLIYKFGADKNTGKVLAASNHDQHWTFKTYPHWTHKVTQFEVLNNSIPKGGIVFLGDSITEGFSVQEFFPNQNIYNRGISSDTTEGIINRLDTTVLNLEPSKIFIMVGINDINAGLTSADILTNYNKILERTRAKLPNSHIFIQSVLPVGENNGSQAKLDRIKEVNNYLKEIPQRDKMISFLEIGGRLKDEKGFLKDTYTEDKLHLNGQAYQVWVNELKGYLVN